MRLEHDPEKWVPVFQKDHAQIKEIERDDDSKKSHRALDSEASAFGPLVMCGTLLAQSTARRSGRGKTSLSQLKITASRASSRASIRGRKDAPAWSQMNRINGRNESWKVGEFSNNEEMKAATKSENWGHGNCFVLNTSSQIERLWTYMRDYSHQNATSVAVSERKSYHIAE